jgi:hypothetical protein
VGNFGEHTRGFSMSAVKGARGPGDLRGSWSAM